jgi:hypothetical protein
MDGLIFRKKPSIDKNVFFCVIHSAVFSKTSQENFDNAISFLLIFLQVKCPKNQPNILHKILYNRTNLFFRDALQNGIHESKSFTKSGPTLPFGRFHQPKNILTKVYPSSIWPETKRHSRLTYSKTFCRQEGNTIFRSPCIPANVAVLITNVRDSVLLVARPAICRRKLLHP